MSRKHPLRRKDGKLSRLSALGFACTFLGSLQAGLAALNWTALGAPWMGVVLAVVGVVVVALRQVTSLPMSTLAVLLLLGSGCSTVSRVALECWRRLAPVIGEQAAEILARELGEAQCPRVDSKLVPPHLD